MTAQGYPPSMKPFWDGSNTGQFMRISQRISGSQGYWRVQWVNPMMNQSKFVFNKPQCGHHIYLILNKEV